MPRGLDMLGASGDGLKSQYITLHVEHIDRDVLKRKLDSMKVSGAVTPAIMMATDQAPKFVVDTALAMAPKYLKDFGITATLEAYDAPPDKGGRKKSEFLVGAISGILLASLVTGIAWTLVKATKVVLG